MKTESEALWEEFCSSLCFTNQRIKESPVSGKRRPDYLLSLRPGIDMVVEVKQFDPNPQERKHLDQPVRSFRTEPGDRIRKAIRSGGPQLKALSEGRRPALLVVFDNTGSRIHTHPYAVLTAMRGLDIVPVSLPADLGKSPEFGPSRPGPKKKMTPTDNTSISAIGVLRQVDDGPFLEVYHNPHASVRLQVGDLDCRCIRHFRMTEDQEDWEETAT